MQLAAAGGAHILAIDVDELAGRETLELLSRAGGTTAEFVRLDVTDRAAWQLLAARVAAEVDAGRFPASLLLINNAGICAASETLAGNPEQWRRIMEVNFFGVLHGCQAFGPLLVQLAERAEPRPAVINVASLAGMIATPSMGAYAASKSAVVALSEALSGELRPAGVHVTIVAPGFFRTGLLDRGEFCTTRHKAEAERLFRNAKFTADDVARAALAASRRGALYCVLGRRARWLWRAKRLAPRLIQRLAARGYHRTFGER
jgi:NAD(P)-dependent dehydrogenase (short-subunit alcohol dehydrogenase family)